MNVVDNILKDLDFKPNEIELYKRIRLDVFLKNRDDDHGTLISKVIKMIDQEYSE